jgi:hypothetical protein
MRQIARRPQGSELQKTEARAGTLQGQTPGPSENNRFPSRDGKGPRNTPLRIVCELIARMFNYLLEMITLLFADHGSVSAVENGASETSGARVDPPISEQPRRRMIVGPRIAPAIKSVSVIHDPARPTLSAFFPPEDVARVTRRTRERRSDRSAGTPGSSTTPTSSLRRSSQQVSATSQHSHRSDNNPAIGRSGNRHLTSSTNPNPRMLLTYKPTDKIPE